MGGKNYSNLYMVSDDVIDFLVWTSNHLVQASTTINNTSPLKGPAKSACRQSMVAAAIPRDVTGLPQAMNGLIDMYHKPLLPAKFQHSSWATHRTEHGSSSSQLWGVVI